MIQEVDRLHFEKSYVHFMHLVLFSSVENKFGNNFDSEEFDGNCS